VEVTFTSMSTTGDSMTDTSPQTDMGTVTNLLRSFAQALAPYLTGAVADEDETRSIVEDVVGDLDIDDRIENWFDTMINIEDKVSDAIGDVDWDDHEVLTQRNFDPTDYDIMDSSDIDVAIDEALDARLGDVVTSDNILSILADALGGLPAVERAA
tara:strand:+ start:134 stop:601 length:468 start_codon:yes stop_codon:yes gene_type:complete